jgi:alpha-glucosidase (family GH31 glycosyl hydrolase)
MNNWTDVVDASNMTNGTQANLTYPDKTINVHLRPGYIVPRQIDAADGSESAASTTDLRSRDYTLYINRDTDGNAQGKLYLDKSDTMQSLREHTYEDYTIQLNKK